MKCPKCHTEINEKQTICHKCHKVLLLECPNCHEIGDSAVCSNCGYTILVKCSKCSKINHIKDINCTKCGFPINTSLAYQECEADEFASVNIKFNGLKKIKKVLNKKNLYEKFYFRLKNLLLAYLKDLDGKVISYEDEYEVSFNKELSFATSSNKAVRFSLKLINAFTNLNKNILEEFGLPLNLVLSITKKLPEELQIKKVYESSVKPLNIKKNSKRYLQGLQIILDEYVRDAVSKDFKTDSLYTVEEGGKTLMFYEILLESYVLPPSKTEDNQDVNVSPQNISKNTQQEQKKDLYSFKVLDINAKCKFEKTNAIKLPDILNSIDLNKEGKIITIRSDLDYRADIEDIIKVFEKRDYNVLTVSCSPKMNYISWGFFKDVFREQYNLNQFDNKSTSIPETKVTAQLLNLLDGKPAKAMTPEDARYNYIETWGSFLNSLKNTVIIADGFENIDDTSLQTLELYFDKYLRVIPNFVFITNKDVSLHSKIKSLIKTNKYTEYTLEKVTVEECLSTIKSDASDFINSFYFEKIKENYNGSYLYFKNAINYLKDNEVLIDFENKYIINSQKSVILPQGLQALYRSIFKYIGKNADAAYIIAYASMLGARLDCDKLTLLGVKDIKNSVTRLKECGIVRQKDNIIYINNYGLLSTVAETYLKKQAEEFIVKNIIAHLGSNLDDSVKGLLLGRINKYNEEYLTLWKNAQFSIKTGDYDAYLKNSLGYLSLVDYLDANIEKSVIEENKIDVYNNILMFLYSYSPAKIYYIENILLMDAIEKGNDEKIVKLSNLMLQGALISSNYTDALGLLHNILSRMKHPTLTVDGEINVKFLLLSLVNIEILYNIGNFKQCVEVAESLLNVLSKESIEKAKPASFSINSFVSHIMDTLRLAALAKMYMLDSDIEEYFSKVQTAIGSELPEKDCINAIINFLADKPYSTDNIEGYSPYSKIIFLILQEINSLQTNYKQFAQNIYQAKLLASDINQKELELFCDLLIGYAYSKVNVEEKAEAIYEDILKTAEKDAIFNILALAKYFIAKLYLQTDCKKEAVKIIKDTLSLIREYENQDKLLFVLCKKLYIDAIESDSDSEAEWNYIEPFKESLKIIVE